MHPMIRGGAAVALMASFLMTAAANAQTAPEEPASAAAAAASSPDAPAPETAASSPAVTPAPVVKPAEPVIAFLNADASSGSEQGAVCYVSGKKLPRGVLVVVVRVKPCSSYSIKKQQYEVLYGKDTYYTPLDALTAVKGTLDEVATRSTQTIDESTESWTLYARQLWLTQANKALAEVKGTSGEGLAIVSAGLFDVSEYTEGTGFRIKVANTGKKTIKYITVSLVGLNAVKDPVRDRFGRSAQVSIRGVGPIEPNESASYSKDYLWMTDLVEDFNLKSIRLEYMDGSSKTIVATKKLWLSRDTTALIFEED